MFLRPSCLLPRTRSNVLLAMALLGTALVLSCSNDDAGANGGAGGHSNGAGGTQVGGTGAGGSVASSTGGMPGTAGAGGTVESTGGRGGAPGTGGEMAVGGRSGSGGAVPTGGAPETGSGGAGGAMVSGSGGAGTGGGAGGASTTCPLPKTFKWTSTGPLAQPKAGWVSLKNFSDVVFNNQHIVYYSGGSTSGSWIAGMMVFADWPDMATATQNTMPMLSAAPTLIYFAPKNIWVLMYQYGQWTFMYSTSTDPTNPSSWSAPHELYNGSHGIDNTVVCNTTTCYLFWTNDDGKVYRSSMPIGSFPGTFAAGAAIMSDTTSNLFEAEQVYAIKGTSQYLMIVEALGSAGRYFRSFTATDLAGSWTPLAASESNPFAGKANVTFSNGNAWTSSISHGDLVRTNPDETQTIDPCNLQFLYQGTGPSSGSYIQIPYRPGLLTLVR